MSISPPDRLWVTWCDKCGRREFPNPNRHFYQQKLCTGIVKRYIYTRTEIVK